MSITKDTDRAGFRQISPAALKRGLLASGQTALTGSPVGASPCKLFATLIILVAFFLSVTACDLFKFPEDNKKNMTTPEFERMSVQKIKMTRSDGSVLELSARIADEPDEQTAGFQFISPDVIKKSLILFAFEEPLRAQFHMRNVMAPLDIAFVAGDGRFLQIVRMDPGNDLYGIDEEFQFALEAWAGFFEENRISTHGSRLLELSSVVEDR